MKWLDSCQVIADDGEVVVINVLSGTASIYQGVRAGAVARVLQKAGEDASREALVGEAAALLEDSGDLIDELVDFGALGEVRDAQEARQWGVALDISDAVRLPAGADTVLSPSGEATRCLRVIVLTPQDLPTLASRISSALLVGDAVLPVLAMGEGGFIGPLTLGGGVACLQCALDRQMANTGVRRLNAVPVSSEAGGGSARFLAHAMLMAASELATLNDAPIDAALLGRMIVVDGSRRPLQYHDVFQNPACPGCKRTAQRLRA